MSDLWFERFSTLRQVSSHKTPVDPIFAGGISALVDMILLRDGCCVILPSTMLSTALSMLRYLYCHLVRPLLRPGSRKEVRPDQHILEALGGERVITLLHSFQHCECGLVEEVLLETIYLLCHYTRIYLRRI